jgi:hypothetical protein
MELRRRLNSLETATGGLWHSGSLTVNHHREHIAQMNQAIVRLGRLGYAVKGIVYIVLGFLATEAAIGHGGKTTDSKGALRAIGQAPFGKVALIVVMVGLFGYAAWRILSAFTDAERRGDKPSSLALRSGEALRGLVYASLGFYTLKYLMRGRASTGNNAPGYVDRALAMPGGREIVIVAGLVFVGYAIYQIYRAVTGKFLKRLDLSAAGPEVKKWVERFGKFGICARAVVFGMIGVLIARAGLTYNPSEAGGIAQSLNAIAREPKGHLLFSVVAIGLIAFGLLQIATARYRVMRA